jgi:serine/threonine protein kinase
MAKLIDELALSRTFKVVGGQLTIEGISMPPVKADSGLTSGAHSARLIGSVIEDKYQVLALLGEGGMGSVYRVVHLLLKKEMALKTFRTAQPSPEAWGRFQIEARAIGKLRHGNIVQVFDFGIGEQNFPYYTMELLSGESLADRIAEKNKLEIDEALSIFIPVACGLAHAHRQGIVHRDIKPANIFLEDVQGSGQGEAEPKIVDFGLAKMAEFQTLDGQTLTAKGLIFGSPLYMSPEQSLGAPTDRRTDIYSFGCSLFQTLTGKPPFRGDNFLATILMHQNKKAPYLGSVLADVIFPARLEAIVARLLAKDLDERYQSFEEVDRDLRDFAKTWRRIETAAPDLETAANDQRGAPVEVNQSDVIDSAASPSIHSVDGDGQKKLSTSAKKNMSILVLIVGIFGGCCFFSLLINSGHRDSQHSVQADQAKQNSLTTRDTHAIDIAGRAANVESDKSREEEAWNKAERRYDPESVFSNDTKKQNLVRSFGAAPVAFSHPGPDGSRIFTFPKIGMPYGSIGGITLATRDAIGEIRLPRGTEINFVAGEAFYQRPELFNAFKPDDVYGLNMDSRWKWEERHFSHISHLSGLRCLLLQSNRLDASLLQSINRLPNLRILDLSKASFSTSDLSRLVNLLILLAISSEIRSGGANGL